MACCEVGMGSLGVLSFSLFRVCGLSIKDVIGSKQTNAADLKPPSSFKHLQETRSGVLTSLLLRGDQTKGDSSDSLAGMTNKDTKENITPEQYITTADVSPSHKWHPSHFSLRCVNDVCHHPS